MNSSAPRVITFCIVVAIILPAEADPARGQTDQAAVGDGDAMGIAAEIIEHLLGSAERALGVDDPANCAQRPQPGSEGGWRGQVRQIAKEPELARLEGHLEAGHEKPAIETRQHLYRQKEAGAQPIQRVLSADGPPPGTTQWTWG
jgi:hypothetical protein